MEAQTDYRASFGPATTNAPMQTTMQRTAPEPIEEILLTKTGTASFQTDEGVKGQFTTPIAELTMPVRRVVEPPAAVQVVPTGLASRAEYDELKLQINDSFEEVANILLDLQQRFQMLDDRIETYNRRGGHKL